MILGDIKKAKWGRRKGVLRNSSCQAHLSRRHYNQDLNEIKKKKKPCAYQGGWRGWQGDSKYTTLRLECAWYTWGSWYVWFKGEVQRTFIEFLLCARNCTVNALGCRGEGRGNGSRNKQYIVFKDSQFCTRFQNSNSLPTPLLCPFFKLSSLESSKLNSSSCQDHG